MGTSERRNPTDPFDPAILRVARGFAAEYQIILEASEDLGYMGTSVEMPTVFADGRTPASCRVATREALTLAVATMIECGDTPPAPVGASKEAADG